ncbi:MAG: CopG family antitoxin [Enterobacteriaceae bacterium]|nr:CopG family antitoxin [Enterobacteriaceae bacterium]
MSKIPKFKSDKQTRAFWDTHSLSDYAEDLKPAHIRFRKPHKEVVSIRLESTLIQALKDVAQKAGIGYSSLARMWVIEKLRKQSM